MKPEYAARLRELEQARNACPNPNEQPTEKKAAAAWVVWRHYQDRFLALANGVDVEAKWGPIDEEVRATHADLLYYETNTSAEVQDIESSFPPGALERLRYENPELRELHAGLKAARYGIEVIGGMEMIPQSLYTFLAQQRGWTKRENTFWRGSLNALEERMADHEKRLGPARAAIAAEMARTVEPPPQNQSNPLRDEMTV
jgi:hypothetical protein